ncbi:hypothetical protein H2C68_07625 [Vibrio alginolyticus]|uniref:DUF3060 domain-containing protein n=1 Tax=Vibrio alginolyticus TaxID=663 RepID=UPI002119C953|nr:DUF3060 domain-containing protein [Vibrio alginolyticus]MCQ9036851.1 hypothetical protein [Vibrio alginolyticus]
MTKNIEDRTLAATTTLESSAKTVDEIANKDKFVSTPVGQRKSFPMLSREEQDLQQKREVDFQDSQLKKDNDFQDRFSKSAEAIDWTPSTVIDNPFQRYRHGVEGTASYKEYLANPALIPFETSLTLDADLQLNRWLENEVASKSLVGRKATQAQSQLAGKLAIWPVDAEHNAKVNDVMEFSTTALRVNHEIRTLDRALPKGAVIDSINLVESTITSGQEVYDLGGALDKAIVLPGPSKQQRTLADKLSDINTVKDYGAKSDGSSPDKVNVEKAFLSTKPKVTLIESTLDISSETNTRDVLPADYQILSPEQKIFNFFSVEQGKKLANPSFRGSRVFQPQLDARANNNHGAFKFSAVDDVDLKDMSATVDIFCGLTYGYETAGSKSKDVSQFANVSMNRVRFSHMGSEILGGSESIQIGNHMLGGKPNGEKSGSHAFRVSGYDGAKATHHIHIGNYSFKCNTGFSYQKTARYNAAFGNVMNNVNDGVQFITSQDEEGNNYPSYQQRYNQNYGIVSNARVAATVEGASYNDLCLLGHNLSAEAIQVNSDHKTGENSVGNTLHGILVDCKDGGISLSEGSDFHRINYSLFNGVGRPFNIRSSYNTGSIIAHQWTGSGALSGNHNMLSLALISVGDSGSLYISGNDNVIIINTDGNIVITGHRNKIIGSVGGTITDTGMNNDKSDISTFLDRGKFFGTTDINGYVDIPHDISSTAYVGFVSLQGSDGSRASPYATNASSLRVRCFDKSGSPLAMTKVTIHYRVETGYF